NIKTEFEHFKETYKGLTNKDVKLKRNISSDKILELWISLERLEERNRKINFIRRFIYRLKYGLHDQTFYDKTLDEMILICQLKYYSTKIYEQTHRIDYLKRRLKKFSFDSKMEEYTNMS